jgi:predicted unusual protein kinase regulating ubiquinone biosynthesis (AarF/ABC1/UbiB family)
VLNAENLRDHVIQAVRHINVSRNCPENDMVAVKVQYRDALSLFLQDLSNLRRLAAFLSQTEIPFDLVSAVDELSSQVKLEFDFMRYVLQLCRPQPISSS